MAPTTYDPNSPNEQPVALPSAPLVDLSENIQLQPPLTRRGHGPGLIVFLPVEIPSNSTTKSDSQPRTESLDPEPVQKWAEEGFAVVGIKYGADLDLGESLKRAVDALTDLPEVDVKDKIGVIGEKPL